MILFTSPSMRVCVFPVLSILSIFTTSVLAQASTSLGSCLVATGVDVSLPGESTFALDSLAWQSRISPVPNAVAFPRNETEIAALLSCASQNKVKVTTLGGNRSFSSLGMGRDNGTLVISMHYFSDINFDSATNYVTLGGSVTISMAANYVWNNQQRALVHGRCPDVGMSGVSFGGGFGTLSRSLGTAMDNLVSVRAVLANGTAVDASATVNPDLFWAIGGAAPSFAVVTHLTIKTHAPPSSQVFNYTIGFASTSSLTAGQNAAALVLMQNWALSSGNSDLLSLRWTLAKASKAAGFFYGSQANFDKTIGSLMNALKPSGMTNMSYSTLSYWDSEEASTPGLRANSNTDRRYFYIESAVVDKDHPLTQASAEALYNNTVYLTPSRSDASLSGLVDLWGGDFTSTITDSSTSWKHANALLLVRWDARTSGPTVAWGSDLIPFVEAGWNKFLVAMRANGWADRGFPNYRNSEWTQQQVIDNMYGAQNWARLLEIKSKLDPAGLFSSDARASVPAPA